MRKGKIIRFINTISSDGIAYFLLHLFQLMGQDFHVAADLLVGYPGIYLGGFQIRMPQKTAYGLDGYTVREQHGGGVRMPGHMIGQPYLETALPAKFLQYGVASAVARYRKYMTVLGQSLILLYDALGHVQQADVGLGVRLAPAGDFFFVRRKYSKLLMKVRLSSFRGMSSRRYTFGTNSQRCLYMVR